MALFPRYALLPLALLAAIPAHAAVEISTKPTQNITCSGGVCTPTAKKAVLNVGDLATILASGDTAIKSSSQNPDIEIDAKLGWTSTSRLTLDSYHAIAFNQPVEVMATGALTITTNDGGFGGDFRFFKTGHVKFSSLKSSLTINGYHYGLANSIRQIGTKHGALLIALAKSIDLSKHGTYFGPPLKHGPLILEGLGNTISHLSIHDSQPKDIVGLTLNVRDLGLVDVDIEGGTQACVGAFGLNVEGTVLNSYVTGRISGGDGSAVGGIVCDSEFATIAHCYSTASILGGSNSVVGGIAGGNLSNSDNFGSLSDSFSSGVVSGGDNAKVGGAVGYNLGGVILNVYATGPVTGGNNSFVGGLVEFADSIQDEASISEVTSSYSLGLVSGGSDATVGGLVGSDVAKSSNTNDYWNLDTSGVTDPTKGAGNIQNDPGITGLSDAQLKSALPSGFDPAIWEQSAKLNSGYPYLIGNPPPK